MLFGKEVASAPLLKECEYKLEDSQPSHQARFLDWGTTAAEAVLSGGK